MTFHVVLPRRMELQTSAAEAVAGRAPRHAMWHLACALDARIHEPLEVDEAVPPLADRGRSVLLPPSSLWSMARRVAREAAPGDVVFCSSEAGGLHLAACLAGHRSRPRLAVFVHNVDRPRARLAMRLWSAGLAVDLFLGCSATQVNYLRVGAGIPIERARFVWDHTDNAFFTPGSPSAPPLRPMIVSVGLEQRDYHGLAAATRDLDVDVRVSGFSKDAAALAAMFPNPLPVNMTRRFYTWPDLVDLYRSASVVVVACRQNRYAAGVQSLMEASACGKPIVATETVGLESYLHDGIVRVPPGDAEAMRSAIASLLEDPVEREQRGQRNLAVAQERHGFDRYVSELADAVRGLA